MQYAKQSHPRHTIAHTASALPHSPNNRPCRSSLYTVSLLASPSCLCFEIPRFALAIQFEIIGSYIFYQFNIQYPQALVVSCHLKMPFVPGTPEALDASLHRRDSKDFDSTCHGINQNGTPCRSKISPSVSAPKTTIDGKDAFFCWRHKEQASALVQKKSKIWSGPARRGSMDVLVEKIVAMTVTDEVKPAEGAEGVLATVKTTAIKTSKVKISTTSSGRKYPFTTSTPIPTILDAPPTIPPLPPVASHKHKVVSFLNGLFNRISSHHHKKQSPNLFSDGSTDDEADDPQLTATTVQQPEAPSHHSSSSITDLLKKKFLSKVRFDTTPESGLPKPAQSALSPPHKHSSSLPGYISRRKIESLVKQSRTAIVPPYLTSATQRLLCETLTKPFSTSDTPGYIYIFSLLPSSPNRPPTMTTSHTIDSNDPQSQSAPRVLLKIGRTVNVASRLNQHANQCNYEPTLIRYYPHPDSRSASTGVVRKVPNVNRIERLIHLELRDNPKVYPDELRHKCTVCGKVHKEWFSVEASEEGVKWVDNVISRWISWGEYWGEGEGAKRAAEEEEAAVRRGEKAKPTTDSNEDEDDDEEVVVTGKAKMETPLRGRERAKTKMVKAKDYLTTPSPARAKQRSKTRSPGVGREASRSPAPVGGGNSRSAERSRQPRLKVPETQESPLRRKKKTVEIDDFISGDEEGGSGSDEEYHDATGGEESESDEGEWVEGDKIETNSHAWSKAKKKRVQKSRPRSEK